MRLKRIRASLSIAACFNHQFNTTMVTYLYSRAPINIKVTDSRRSTSHLALTCNVYNTYIHTYRSRLKHPSAQQPTPLPEALAPTPAHFGSSHNRDPTSTAFMPSPPQHSPTSTPHNSPDLHPPPLHKEGKNTNTNTNPSPRHKYQESRWYNAIRRVLMFMSGEPDS